jgi:hypothetical protein
MHLLVVVDAAMRVERRRTKVAEVDKSVSAICQRAEGGSKEGKRPNDCRG